MLSPRTPQPSGIPLRRGAHTPQLSRERPLSHTRSLSHHSFSTPTAVNHHRRSNSSASDTNTSTPASPPLLSNQQSGPISVHAVIRIKPSPSGVKSSIAEHSNSSITVSAASQKRTFIYDHIFGPQTAQTEIYSYFANATDQFVGGYNVTIMAYGQSGSGKSYTMGTESRDSHDLADQGIVERASADLFRLLREKTDYTLKVSYLELYNEQFRDLLDNTPKPQPLVREDSHGVVVIGLNHVTVSSLEEVLSLLQTGSELRQKGSTALNSVSSRSHAIFTVSLTQNGATSKFNFVDLAGSERLKNSEATGDRVKEGIAINGGLAALGKVISQLSQAGSSKPHISYRDSKLTRLLQDSLGGKAITYLLSCITSDDTFVSETLSTLSYTQRARAIQLTPEIQQAEGVEVDQLRREMEYWKSRARELERSRDSPSRFVPSRLGERSRDQSPTKSIGGRQRPRSAIYGHRRSRDLSQEDFSQWSNTPDSTFSPQDSATDLSRETTSPRDTPSRLANGLERLSHTTEMHVAIEDMIKQYDLRILGLQASLEEEQLAHLNTKQAFAQKVACLETLLGQRGDQVTALQLKIQNLERNECEEVDRAEDREEVSSRGTVVSDATTRESGDSRDSRDSHVLESRISVLEAHLDKARIQQRQTLDELKRLTSHYEITSRDLERSRKEIEKEKQLRFEVIAQMKRSSIIEEREEVSPGGNIRHRIGASFTSSLFNSLPRVKGEAEREVQVADDVSETPPPQMHFF